MSSTFKTWGERILLLPYGGGGGGGARGTRGRTTSAMVPVINMTTDHGWSKHKGSRKSQQLVLGKPPGRWNMIEIYKELKYMTPLHIIHTS